MKSISIKMLFLSLIIMSSFFSCQLNAQASIGKIVDGVPELTQPKLTKKSWETFLEKHLEKKIRFDHVKIVLQDGDYLLFGTNANIVAIVELRMEDGQIYEGLVKGTTRTVTCSGCTAGCSPVKDKHGSWFCTAGCDDCKKTETVTEESILTQN